MKSGLSIDAPSNQASHPHLSKINQVKKVFENPPHYLRSRSVDIRFRMECVKTFAEIAPWSRLLDIGCGDGSITAPLMRPGTSATLLDCSASMLALAKNRIPDLLKANVDIRNEDFSTSVFQAESFDLIVTVGVMAHVDSPKAFLTKIKGLLRPGGRLILEFTDAHHPVGRIGRGLGSLKEMVAPPRYITNKFSAKDVNRLLGDHGFRLVSVFRYSRIPLPGIDRFMSRDMHYNAAKLLFGTCTDNRVSALGNEYICLLESN